MRTANIFFEWSAHSKETSDYRLALSWDGADGEGRTTHPSLPLVRIPFDALRAATMDPSAYASLISFSVFGASEIREKFLAVANGHDYDAVNLLMRPDETCSELHSVRWELLRHPGSEMYLSQGGRVSLSRFVDVPGKVRFPDIGKPMGDLRALSFFANPSNPADYDFGEVLTEIDTEALGRGIRAAASGMQLDEVRCRGEGTYENLLKHLNSGYDVLFLVCHGAIKDGKSVLLLEDWTGEARGLPGATFINAIASLREKPVLIVLACCHSAGTGGVSESRDEVSLSSLGPQISMRGVPCVIALQGGISQSTMSLFLTSFAEELQRHGNAFQAVSVARACVQSEPDWWCPAIISCTKKGMLWRSGFTSNDSDKDWGSVINSVKLGFCTPIVGPGLMEHITGSRRELTRSFATNVEFPLASHSTEELPQVMQFLTVHDDSDTALVKYLEFLDLEIARRFRSVQLTEGDAVLPVNERLLRRISLVGEHFRSDDVKRKKDPYWLLAKLDLKVFITTNPDNLLLDALEEVGKHPVAKILDWTSEKDFAYSVDEPEPTVDSPTVYYLLGHLNHLKSMVLSEDDHFRFLSRSDQVFPTVPTYVQRAITDSSLLLLGYQTDGWDYRVLLTSFLSKERRARDGRAGRKYTKVGVQLDPTMGRTTRPEEARKYLETYFLEKAEIRIYWDNPVQFVQRLYEGFAQ